MIDAAVAVGRLLFDAAALFLWGSAAYLATLVPTGLRARLWDQLTAARWIATGTLVLSLTALLPLRTALIGDGWMSATDPQLLFAVVTATNIGAAWSIQVVLSVILLLVLTVLPAKAAAPVVAWVALGLLASLSLTGHAAMNPGWLGFAQQLNNGLHLVAGGFWVGALPVILLLLPQLAASSDVALALKRFSNAGHLAVVLVVLSGIVSARLITGDFPPEPVSLYGTLLLAKLVLVAAMVIVAIVNRYVFVPRLRARPGDTRALVGGTITELVLVGVVLGLVATFGMMEPTS